MVAELVQRAWEYHRSGSVAEAERLYRQALELDPEHDQANGLLGALLVERTQMAEAELFLRKAIEQCPHNMDARENLGTALARQGRYEEAIKAYEVVLLQRPDNSATYQHISLAYSKLGNHSAAMEAVERGLERFPASAGLLSRKARICERLGRYDEAQTCYQVALRDSISAARPLVGLAESLLKQGKFEESILPLRQIAQLDPENAGVLNSLATAFGKTRQYGEAERLFRQAIELRPNMTELHLNLGNTYFEQNRIDESLECYLRALEINPDYALAHIQVGSVNVKKGRFAEAEAALQRALQLAPQNASAAHNLAFNFFRQHRFDDAMTWVEQAIAWDPELVDAHSLRALIWLTLGDFERGFAEYEWRWKTKAAGGPRPEQLTKLEWDGRSSLDGSTIYVYSEQGLGDQIQFIRLLSELKRQGAKVIFGCRKPMLQLLQSFQDLDELTVDSSPPAEFDVTAPLLMLPSLLNLTVDRIPNRVPYLFPREDLVEKWRQRLQQLGGFRVGIAWQGNRAYLHDYLRSVPLSFFEPLAKVPGVTLVSLQREVGTEQIAEMADRFRVVDLGKDVDANEGAFVDTAAIMKNLDLVVTTDTAIPHLAGAIGVPVWVALGHFADWRWFLNREDSPWYPAMRLFRQARDGDWADVFDRIAGTLSKLIAQRAHEESRPIATHDTRPLLVEISAGELIDKITILEIKRERITDPAKLRNVEAELETLSLARWACLPGSVQMRELTQRLREVNECLWEIEDNIRDCERHQDFGKRFIELARSVYVTNDKRAEVKRHINRLFESRLIEEKSYATY